MSDTLRGQEQQNRSQCSMKCSKFGVRGTYECRTRRSLSTVTAWVLTRFSSDRYAAIISVGGVTSDWDEIERR